MLRLYFCDNINFRPFVIWAFTLLPGFMSGEIGQLARGSIIGLPPRAVNELIKDGCTDAVQYLDHRGVHQLAAIQEAETREKKGCLETVLTLPGFRQIREALPQDFKNRVKSGVKSVLYGEGIEP